MEKIINWKRDILLTLKKKRVRKREIERENERKKEKDKEKGQPTVTYRVACTQ